MEAEPWFFGLLDPDPSDSDPVPDPGLTVFEEKGNSMLKIIRQSKHFLRKFTVQKIPVLIFPSWGF
jgi:hypothetical protein